MSGCGVIWHDEIGCLPGPIEHACRREGEHSKHYCQCGAMIWDSSVDGGMPIGSR